MQPLLQDLRFALRALRKSPVFSTIAILSLALGIGANTAIFTLMDQLLLRYLPVKHPEQLVMLDQLTITSGLAVIPHSFSYPMYKDFRDKGQVFSGVLARFPLPISVGYHGQTERTAGEIVSGNYFEVLGISAYAGRTLTPDDDRTPGGHLVAFLTYGYWIRQFGGDRSILNQTLLINGHPMTVVGIGPPGFDGVEVGRATDIMAPIMMQAQIAPGLGDVLGNRRTWWLNVFGRLRSDVPLKQAEASCNVLFRQINTAEFNAIPGVPERFRDRFVNKHLDLLPAGRGLSDIREQASEPLTVLMAMVGLVLLIACANIANLLIARAAGRQKEIAVRLALGAGRTQIVRQLLVESMLLAALGGGAGLLVASWTIELLLWFLPSGGVSTLTTTPDLRVLAFNFGVAIAAGLLFGLAPALRAARPNLAATLKDQTGSVAGGFAQVRLRKLLVVAQVAVSLLLLVGAGLFAHSLYNLRSVDLGFRTENLMTFSLDPSLNGYDESRTQALYARLQDDIEALPGVRSVSMADDAALTEDVDQRTVTVEGHYPPKEDEDMNPWVKRVGPGYFATLGVPLSTGREFSKRDVQGAPQVGMINETAAEYFFPHQNPIGKHFGFGGRRGIADIEIVGVVKDDKGAGLKRTVPRFVYAPSMQQDVGKMTVYVRTVKAPEQLALSLRQIVMRADANLPMFAMKTMETQLDEHLFTERLIAMLSAAFGFLATMLAAIGLYGVMAYMVARRTREIGIRIALGADRLKVVWMVMREVGWMAAIGMAIGLACAIVLGRFVQSQLFGLAAYDPLTLMLATFTLGAAAIAAGYIPALRATRVDPVVALRYE
jgi:predicted permease